MNMDFYQYITLNINPTDDLLGNKYHMARKLGHGLTSRVYLHDMIADAIAFRTTLYKAIELEKSLRGSQLVLIHHSLSLIYQMVVEKTCFDL